MVNPSYKYLYDSRHYFELPSGNFSARNQFALRYFYPDRVSAEIYLLQRYYLNHQNSYFNIHCGISQPINLGHRARKQAFTLFNVSKI